MATTDTAGTPGMATTGTATGTTTENASTDTHPHPRQNFGADAAPDPAHPADAQTAQAGIQEAFVADRQMFWSRFTSFTTGSVIAIVLLLIAMAVFLR